VTLLPQVLLLYTHEVMDKKGEKHPAEEPEDPGNGE